MITRGHSCLRRGKLSSFLDNVAIPASNSEPLQFLYPLFAKDLLAKSHARPSTTSRARLPRQLTPFRSRNQLDRGNPRRFLTQDAIHAESRGAGVAEVSAHTTTTEPNCGRGGFLERFDDDRSPSSGNSSTASQIKHERECLYASNEEGALDPESRDQHVDITNKEPEEAPPAEPESIEVSPTIRIVLTKVPTPEEKRRQALIRSREEVLARSLAHVTTPGQAKKIRYREFTASRPTSKSKMPPHWTELMARLERMQNETIVTPHKGIRKEILLREETVAFFSGTTRSMENIWYVRVRNGCKVQALDCLESEGIYRRVILSGTKRTIELVEKQFRQYDEQILQSGLPPVVPSMLALRQQGKTPPLIRSWWFAAPNNDHRSKIPEPASDAVVTNIRSFNRLIEQWVYHEPSVKDYWHAHRVKDELVNLFTKPEYKLYHSSNALHLALSFLTDHEFLDSARGVFEAARMVATTNTFNVFLRATAKRQNPWYYESILTEMERSGLQPNGHTWITLLRFLVSPGPRREVMRRMKELGLTDDIRVLHDMVENDLGLMVSNFLSENPNIQTFIDSLKQDYGSDLVTTNLLNGVLNATFLRRDFALTSDILKCYERFGLSLNARTFTAALPVFYRIGPAVEIMTPYLRDYEHLLNQRHYEMLFLDAIASNAFNACRVIWKYACMRGEVSPKMQHIVLLSLLGTSKTRQMDNPEHITYHIGALVIGLPYSLAQRSKSSSTTTTTSITKAASLVPPQFQRDPLIYLLHRRNYLRHSEKKKLVTALMEEDVKQGHNYRPVEPFTVMLDAAVRLDSSPEYSWDQSNVDSRPALKKLPTIDILKQAIDVPIE